MKENEKENLNELNKEKENFENLIISLNDIDPTIQKEIVQTINLNNNNNKEKIINFIKTNKEKFIDKLN
jgi:ribulose bisphosphate carboxylase small subunit